MDENKKRISTIGGVLFIGCMFIGFGLGFYFNRVPTGLFIGMGVGFIAMGLTWAFMK